MNDLMNFQTIQIMLGSHVQRAVGGHSANDMILWVMIQCGDLLLSHFLYLLPTLSISQFAAFRDGLGLSVHVDMTCTIDNGSIGFVGCT